MKKIQESHPKIIFDVGANIGDWAIPASNMCPQAKIFSFEPLAKTFSELEKVCKNKTNIQVFKFGLSDTNETLTFYTSDISNELASSIKIVAANTNEEIQTDVRRGDLFCKEHKVEHINFLKVDVEGMEHKVFEGLKQLIVDKKIDIIQFEYGLVNIESKYLLKDYYQFFKHHGYIVGKLYPTAIDFNDYLYESENFFGPNYIAVLPEFKARYLS